MRAHHNRNHFFFYVTATLRLIVSEEFWKVRTADVLLTRYLFLIGGYSEILFSDTREFPCAYVFPKKAQICHTYLQYGCNFGKSNSGKEFLITTEVTFPDEDWEKRYSQVLLYIVEGSTAVGGSDHPPKLWNKREHLPPPIASPGCCIHLCA